MEGIGLKFTLVMAGRLLGYLNMFWPIAGTSSVAEEAEKSWGGSSLSQ